MGKPAALIILTALFLACVTAEATPPEGARDAPPPVVGELEAFLARLDKRQETIERLSADITITSVEEFSGRESTPRSGRLYIRKPHDIHVDLTQPRARKIWITEKEIVDYKPALSTAEKVVLGEDSAGPEIIGLSTTFDELRERFEFALQMPRGTPRFYTLKLEPKPDVEADFTRADIQIDARTLLPSEIVHHDDRLGMKKTFAFSNIEENPRLSDAVFEVKLKSGTSVAEFTTADWKGI